MAVLLGGHFPWSPEALAEHYSVPLLVGAGASGDPQGVLRILNGTDESATVAIYAIDDSGIRSGPASFTLNAASAAEFTAAELQSGNVTLGLTGGIGEDVGDTRLEIETDLRIVPLAFVEAADGTLSAMHDTVRQASADGSGQYRYEVPVFNPSSEMTQVSRLRLINPGDSSAAISVGARDDSGAEAAGGEVTLSIAGGGARTLTARQLEAGDTSITGRLGAGTGKRRLTVSSDRPLEVVNIVASTAGYWSNLSTTAAAGSAPADHEAFTERLLEQSIVYETDSARFTLNVTDGERFNVAIESDGVTTANTGKYSYAAMGPDAGRLTLDYDDGDRCQTNLYFSTRTSGWMASLCTATEDPDGYWIGGSWKFEGNAGGGDTGTDDVMETAYGVNDALPGVPTSGAFVPAVTSGGSVTATADGTTVALDDGGYIELNDGTRYTCASADGCTITNGTVTAGTVTGRAAGTGEVDRFPSFRNAAAPGNPSYTAGAAIDTLTLPEASGGNGTLTYSLSPGVPGLTFNASTRQLTGTPSAAGTHAMTYTVTDEDGDTDTLGFTITVSAGTASEGSLGVCRVGMTLSSGQSCTYPDTADEFSVNSRGRGRFLGFLAGIRIRIENETIDGRVYDFEASHRGDGVWRIDRIAGSTEVPTAGGGTGTGSSPSFPADAGPGDRTYTAGTAISALALPEATGGDGTLTYELSPDVPGLTFNAATRQLTGTPSAPASYNMTYSATDEDGDSDTLAFAIVVEPGTPTGGEMEESSQPAEVSFEVGDTLADLPTGVWTPDATGGPGVLIRNFGRTISLGQNGYFEYGGYRYMCRGAGGCEVENRVVVSGTIVQISFAPLDLADRFPDSRLLHVYNDNLIVMHVDEDVSRPGLMLAEYAADFFRWFEDEFDYLLFLSNLSYYRETVNFGYAGIYYSVMNDTEGLGLSRFLDNRYGSAGRLRGVIHFPRYTNLRKGPTLHELHHAWANFAVPTSNASHWGFSSANGQLGGFDIANLADLGDGRWSAGDFFPNANYGNRLPYSPIELYFAGLLPREEVPDLWVAETGQWLLDDDGAPVTTASGDRIFTAENVRTMTVADIVAEHGERNPLLTDRPHQRAAAILLVDDDRLPSAPVLETASEYAAWLGLKGDDGDPADYNYYEATGGRGTLTLDGLAQFQKSEAAPTADLPASYGVVPPPR